MSVPYSRILRVYVDVCKMFQCVLKGSCDQHNVIARNIYKNCEAIKRFLAKQLLHKNKNKTNQETPNLFRLSPWKYLSHTSFLKSPVIFRLIFEGTYYYFCFISKYLNSNYFVTWTNSYCYYSTGSQSAPRFFWRQNIHFYISNCYEIIWKLWVIEFPTVNMKMMKR